MCNDSSIIFKQKCSHLYNNLASFLVLFLSVLFCFCIALSLSVPSSATLADEPEAAPQLAAAPSLWKRRVSSR